MIFTDTESHISALKQMARRKPEAISIATYNIYAGILHDGEDTTEWEDDKFRNQAHEFLDAIAKIQGVRILVGISPLIMCKKLCEDCLADGYKRAVRLVKHKERWPRFEWRFTDSFHFKCYLFHYKNGDVGVGGGRNLSNSDWTDMSFVLNKKQIIAAKTLFDLSWEQAQSVTMENLENTIKSQL
jgi:hypothetical protein